MLNYFFVVFCFSFFFFLILFSFNGNIIPICCSLGDGIQYPVQIKQLLQENASNSAISYESMETSAIRVVDDQQMPAANHERIVAANDLKCTTNDDVEIGLLNNSSVSKPINEHTNNCEGNNSHSIDIDKMPV